MKPPIVPATNKKWSDSQASYQQYASLTPVQAKLSPLLVHGELSITFHEEVMLVTPVSVKTSRVPSLNRLPRR